MDTQAGFGQGRGILQYCVWQARLLPGKRSIVMRLTEEYAATIRAGVRKIFGPDARVWLFGSRTDDTARGGDIDLYIEASCPVEKITSLEGHLYAFLIRRLGEQRIDIVVRPVTATPRPIDEEAKRTGVRL